jgi:hypothetical protein
LVIKRGLTEKVTPDVKKYLKINPAKDFFRPNFEDSTQCLAPIFAGNLSFTSNFAELVKNEIKLALSQNGLHR